MNEARKITIVQFLADFQCLAQHEMTVIPRAKNTQALLDMGLTFTDRRNAILSLTVEDYSSGPLDDCERAGVVWIFGKWINETEVYVKLKLVEYIPMDTATLVKKAVCISFHQASEPLEYPFK